MQLPPIGTLERFPIGRRRYCFSLMETFWPEGQIWEEAEVRGQGLPDTCP